MYHFFQVSPASSERSLSESSEQKNANLGESQVFPTETPSMAHDSKTLSAENLELQIPATFDISKTQSEFTLTNQSSSQQERDEKLSFSKQSENCGSEKLSLLIPDSLCQTTEDNPDEQLVMSSESTPTALGSWSPPSDQLQSDLEDMKLKIRLETTDPPLSESNDESLKGDQIREVEDLPHEDQCPTENSDALGDSVSSVLQLKEDTNHTNVVVTDPAHLQTSVQDEPEIVSVTADLTKTSETIIPSSPDSPVHPAEFPSVSESPQRFCELMEPSFNSDFPLDIFLSSKYDEDVAETFSPVSFDKVATESQSDVPEEQLTNLCEEDFSSDIQSQEELESAISCSDFQGVTETTQSPQDQSPNACKAISVEATQGEDLSSFSDVTVDTVKSARQFSFEELMPYPSQRSLETSSDEDRPRTSGPHSEESLTPVDSDCFDSLSPSIKSQAEMTSSASDLECSIPPGYAETCSTATVQTHMPPEYSKVVHVHADSPTFEYSDPESYFDCKQAASDFSETEPDEPDLSARPSGEQLQDHISQPRKVEQVNRRALLSSGSEDYEDAPFVYEPFHNVQEENKELLNFSEASDEEFSLCEAAQPPPVCEIGANDDTDKYFTRVR